MLVPYSDAINPETIDPFRVTQEGYHALATGEIALLGYPDYDLEPHASALTIAEILLQNPSTAIMHFENPGDREEINGVMIGVNYHSGHSEGWHKIIVQDPTSPAAGQWMLWAPPGADNRTFYRRALSLDGQPYRFEETPTNPEKIGNYVLHAGPSDEAVTSFEGLGFKFIDKLLSPESDEYERLHALSRANVHTWNPYQP